MAVGGGLCLSLGRSPAPVTGRLQEHNAAPGCGTGQFRARQPLCRARDGENISLTGSLLSGTRARAPIDLVCRGQALEVPRQGQIQSHGVMVLGSCSGPSGAIHLPECAA